MKGVFLMSVFVVALLVFAGGALAKKNNLSACSDFGNIGSTDLFGYKHAKHSGYDTYTYFDSTFGFLGQEQYDGEGNQLFDTYDGDCEVSAQN